MDLDPVDLRQWSVRGHHQTLFIKLEPQRISLEECSWFRDAGDKNFWSSVVDAAFRGKWQSGSLYAKKSWRRSGGLKPIRRGRDLPDRLGELNGADAGAGPEGGLRASKTNGQGEFKVAASRNLEPFWKSVD